MSDTCTIASRGNGYARLRKSVSLHVNLIRIVQIRSSDLLKRLKISLQWPLNAIMVAKIQKIFSSSKYNTADFQKKGC